MMYSLLHIISGLINPKEFSSTGVIASEAKQSLPPALSQDWEKSWPIVELSNRKVEGKDGVRRSNRQDPVRIPSPSQGEG